MKNAFKTVFTVVIILALAMFLVGCKGDQTTTTSTSGTGGGTASVATNVPKGTVQGYLLDATTQEPIAGAVIDIGVATAITNVDGQYVLRDVPAVEQSITSTSNGQVVVDFSGQYYVTINMKGVTSPVAMGNTALRPRYSDFYFNTLTVNFEAISNVLSSGTGSSSTGASEQVLTWVRDTYNQDFFAGKMAATIQGVVVNSVTEQPVGAGYTVKLVTRGDSENAGAGANGSGFNENVVSSTTTTTGGAFTFSNIESMKDFTIKAWDASPMTTYGSLDVTAPADGQTLYLLGSTTYAGVAVGTAYQAPVQVASIDAINPFVIATSIENNSDLGAVTSASVAFTFSETIKPNFYALGTSPTVAGQIVTVSTPSTVFQDVVVTFDGNKGDVAYSLAWDSTTAPRVLTVTVPNLAPASWYTVNIGGAVTRLTDLSDVTGSTTTKDSVKFSTSGAVAAAAPSPVVGYDLATIDVTGGTVNLDWNPVAGAKAYNIYSRINQVYSAGTNAGAWEFLANVTASQYAATIGALEERNEIQLTADLAVTSVNADGVESATSTAINVVDLIQPRLVSCVATTVAVNGVNETRLTATFNEPMKETTVEQAVGNYVFSPVQTPTSLRYTPAANGTVLMTFGGLISNGTYTLTVGNTGGNITDLAGNALDNTNARNVCNFTY